MYKTFRSRAMLLEPWPLLRSSVAIRRPRQMLVPGRNGKRLLRKAKRYMAGHSAVRDLRDFGLLTSHLVREHQRNTSDTNPGSCAVTDRLTSRVLG